MPSATSFVALCALASALTACSAVDDGPTSLDCSNLTCLVPNRPYRYRPTREARRLVMAVTPPAIELPESAYDPLESDPTHTVTFSAELEEVELESLEDGQVLRGTQQDWTSDRIAYDLDAFAGGQFIVTWRQPDLTAELTLFGSGVPIASSTRGLLTPQRGQD